MFPLNSFQVVQKSKGFLKYGIQVGINKTPKNQIFHNCIILRKKEVSMPYIARILYTYYLCPVMMCHEVGVQTEFLESITKTNRNLT